MERGDDGIRQTNGVLKRNENGVHGFLQLLINRYG